MSIAALHQLVRDRARNCCEYCQLPSSASAIPFEIDHIIARKHGGRTEEANLALSCWYCNSSKGPCVGGISPSTGEFVRLFHPRQDAWTEHFEWNGGKLTALTDVGDVTIAVLAMNDAILVEVRTTLIELGEFPPSFHQL